MKLKPCFISYLLCDFWKIVSYLGEMRKPCPNFVTWASYLTFLCLSNLLCKMGIKKKHKNLQCLVQSLAAHKHFVSLAVVIVIPVPSSVLST